MATEASTMKQSDNDEEATSMKFDVIGHLPLEIAQKILFQLSPEDLYSAASCCLSWKAALSCDFFWERLCRREGYLEVEEPKRSEFYTNLLQKYNYWQGLYWYNHTLHRNWETNNYSEVIYEIDNPDHQWLFEDAFVYTTEGDKILNVYDFNSKEINPHVFQLDDYFDGSLILKSGKYLILFNYFSNLTVWNLENGSTIRHNHDSNEIYVYKNLIVLPIFFEKFEVFNIETEQIEYCFEFEPWKMTYNMSLMDGRFIFITTDDVIHILKLDDMSLVTLTCCNELDKPENHKVMLKDDILLSFCHRHRGYGCYDIFLCVWNIKTMTKLHSTLFDYSIEYSMTFINEYIHFWGSYVEDELNRVEFQTIVLWDYMKRTEETTLNYELRTSYPDIYTSNDHVMIVRHLSIIKMWCLSTRDYICELNFISRDYTYCEVEISETKLICAILPKEGHHIKVYVRDFENF